MGGQCLQKNIVYQAIVTQEDQTVNSYTGLSSSNFKARLAVHTQSFNSETLHQTSLSKFIWSLKHKNKKFGITWKIQDRGTDFSPLTNKCKLCDKEKFYILFRPGVADINKRDEIFTPCIHRKFKLLIPPERKKKGPG